KCDPPLLTAGKRRDHAIRIRRVQIRDQTFDSMLQIPTVEMGNLVEQDSAPGAFRRRRLVFGNQIENLLRTRDNIGVNRSLLLQLEQLRHVTDDEIAPL